MAELLLLLVEILSPKPEHSSTPPSPYKVPRSEWARVVQRLAQGELLRQVACSYGASYEAVRRVLAAERRSYALGEEESLD